MDRKILLSWVVSVALLLVVANAIDWGVAVRQLSMVSFFVVVGSSLVYSFSFFFRALRWKYLVKPVAEISVMDSFFIVNVSFLANFDFPFLTDFWFLHVI